MLKKLALVMTVIILIFGLFPNPTNVNANTTKTNIIDETIIIDPSYQHEPFDGWGTALVWFGNVTGGWPDEIRNELADALFSEEGLNFNIARYNIGGEDSPETEPYMRLGGAVPGYWNRPAEFGPPSDADEDWQEQDNWWDPDNPDHWDWEKDKNQQWWLKAAKERGANIFEAFSNSPPYFMTESGYASGNFNSWDDNLRSDQYENFAVYLTRVVDYLQKELDIDIQTLSPVNEPNNGYWGAKGRQEGSNWSYTSQAKIINEVAKQLDELNLSTVVSAMDETNPQKFRESWERFDETTRSNIGQMNVHTYWPAQRTPIRDIAKAENKRLWMSEVDLGPSGIPQDFENIEPGLALSERITSDIKNLEPKAWVLWQAIEDQVNMNADHENMNWGLIHVDFDPDDFDTLAWHYNKKYYTMGNYTKFIRPGFQFVNTNHEDALAAIDKDNDQVVVVYTNHANDEKTIQLDLSNFKLIGYNAVATPYVTSKVDNLSQKEDIPLQEEMLLATVEAKSVTTFVISNVSGVDSHFIKQDTNYKIVNQNSNLVLDVEQTSLVQNENERGQESQEWLIEKVSDGFSYREIYKIVNGESGEVLTANGRSVVTATDNNQTNQHWIISHTGTGEYTFINVEHKELLEVGGQSTAVGASVGLWPPNAGSNQAWRIVEAGITKVDPEIIWTVPGVAPDLPSEVTAYYGDGEPVVKEVEWEQISPNAFARENQFEITGTLENTSVKATATIYVSEVAEIIDSKLKTVPGIKPILPEEVTVKLNLGVEVLVPVIWKEIDESLYAQLGTFTVTGTVENSDIEAIAYVKVSERAIENIALNLNGSGYPQASASFTGRWDSTDHVNDGIYSSERWTNWDPNEWRETDWLQIEFAEERTISEVKFTFYDDFDGTRPPESLFLEYWDGSNWIEIPNTRIEVEAIEETIKFPALKTSIIRAQMTAIPNACIAIVEMEVMGFGDTPAISADATLQDIIIDGEKLSDFSPDQLNYQVILAEDHISLPTVEVIPSDIFASYEIHMPTSIPGEVVITVVSEDKETTRNYTINILYEDDRTGQDEENSEEDQDEENGSKEEDDHEGVDEDDDQKGQEDLDKEDGQDDQKDQDHNQVGKDTQDEHNQQEDDKESIPSVEADDNHAEVDVLPKTATSIFNLLLLGILLFGLGSVFYIRTKHS